MPSIEWLCCRWPWVTPNYLKPPQFLHFAWSGHVIHYNFWGSDHITGTVEPEVVKCCTQVGHINSSNTMTYHPQKGRDYGHVTVLKHCRLPWCSTARGFVSDSWATCYPPDAMLARYLLSSCVRLSVRPSVTFRYCTKKAKYTITKTTSYDSTGTSILCHQRSRRNSKGVTPIGHAKVGEVGYSQRLVVRPIFRSISETVQDRDIVTMKR